MLLVDLTQYGVIHLYWLVQAGTILAGPPTAAMAVGGGSRSSSWRRGSTAPGCSTRRLVRREDPYDVRRWVDGRERAGTPATMPRVAAAVIGPYEGLPQPRDWGRHAERGRPPLLHIERLERLGPRRAADPRHAGRLEPSTVPSTRIAGRPEDEHRGARAMIQPQIGSSDNNGLPPAESLVRLRDEQWKAVPRMKRSLRSQRLALLAPPLAIPGSAWGGGVHVGRHAVAAPLQWRSGAWKSTPDRKAGTLGVKRLAGLRKGGTDTLVADPSRVRVEVSGWLLLR